LVGFQPNFKSLQNSAEICVLQELIATTTALGDAPKSLISRHYRVSLTPALQKFEA
jgi:hypothetical protein